MLNEYKVETHDGTAEYFHDFESAEKYIHNHPGSHIVNIHRPFSNTISKEDNDVHDDKDVKPTNITQSHKNAIQHFSGHSSDEKNGHRASNAINDYLRNREGDKKVGINHGHSTANVRKAVSSLSSAFTKENTNRKEIVTHGGVPDHIGHALKKAGPGSHHHLPGFTSTSTSERVAHSFATNYNKYKGKKPEESEHHVITYHLKPHSGLSVRDHSKVKSEHEVLLHHGAHIEYTHSDKPIKHSDGSSTHVHHVTVHPDHKPLEHYGTYNHPSHL